MVGIYADPIYLGDYPATVRAAVPWLPHFTPAQKKALAGSCDFFALNHCAPMSSSAQYQAQQDTDASGSQ